MTAANRSRSWIDRRATAKEGGGVAMHIMPDPINRTISTLFPTASRLTKSAAATHIHKLVQRLAGILLDPLRSWPRYEE